MCASLEGSVADKMIQSTQSLASLLDNLGIHMSEAIDNLPEEWESVWALVHKIELSHCNCDFKE